jgi:hypothetical protein
MTGHLRRLPALLTVASLAACVAAANGFAATSGGGLLGGTVGGVLDSLSNCGYGPSRQEFLPWLDLASYSLAPQGDLASTSEWSLDGATVSGEHDPYGGSVGSLSFSANGDSAVTPTMCVNLVNPSMRFFVANHGGGNGYLDVVLDYVGLDGAAHRAQLARVSPGSSWRPSPVVLIGANLLSALSVNGETPISFELHAGGLSAGETISADGIWVDPFCRR